MKKTKILVVALALAVVAGGGVAAYVLLGGQQPVAENQGGGTLYAPIDASLGEAIDTALAEASLPVAPNVEFDEAQTLQELDSYDSGESAAGDETEDSSIPEEQE